MRDDYWEQSTQPLTSLCFVAPLLVLYEMGMVWLGQVNGFLMREAGLDYRSSEAVGVVVDTGCQFHGEIAFPDTLDVGIRVRRLGNSSVTYEIGIFRQGRDEPAATGHFVHVYVAHGEMTPVPIPVSARAALEKLLVQG